MRHLNTQEKALCHDGKGSPEAIAHLGQCLVCSHAVESMRQALMSAAEAFCPTEEDRAALRRAMARHDAAQHPPQEVLGLFAQETHYGDVVLNDVTRTRVREHVSRGCLVCASEVRVYLEVFKADDHPPA